MAEPSFTLTHSGIGKFWAPAGTINVLEAVGLGLVS
jgi:hypothetical protein